MSRLICLGEAVVDFLAEPAGSGLTGAERFVPSFGGSQANVAVGAARLGAGSALAGCAGVDPWGAWLRDGLEREGVDVALYGLRDDVATTLAFVALDDAGEPQFSIWGGAPEGMLTGVEESLLEIVAHEPPGAIAFGSDTLIAPRDRTTVAALKDACAANGWRTLYDPNLRPGRWAGNALMLAVATAALAGVTVVKANRDEAAFLTGEGDPAAAAVALLAAGAQQAVVTLAADGALVVGHGGSERFRAEDVDVVDATGAGDAVAAVIADELVRSPGVSAETMMRAMRIAGHVVGARGALAGFPRG